MKKRFGHGTVEVYRVYSGGGQGYDPSGRYYGVGLPVYSVTYEDDERDQYTGHRGRELTVEVRARSISEAIEAAGDEITRRLHIPRREWGRTSRRAGAVAASRSHIVADFNTFADLVAHAADQLGASHVAIELVSGTGKAGPGTKIFFPRGGQYPYEEARVWRKSGYWHAEGPGARTGISRLPGSAVPIEHWLVARGSRRAAEPSRRRRRTPRRRR